MTENEVTSAPENLETEQNIQINKPVKKTIKKQKKETETELSQEEVIQEPLSKKVVKVRQYGLVEIIIVTLICNLLCLYAYNEFFVQKFEAIDVVAYMQQQKDDLMNGKIDTETMDKNLAKLEIVSKQLKNNVIYLDGSAVVKNIKIHDVNEYLKN